MANAVQMEAAVVPSARFGTANLGLARRPAARDAGRFDQMLHQANTNADVTEPTTPAACVAAPGVRAPRGQSKASAGIGNKSPGIVTKSEKSTPKRTSAAGKDALSSNAGAAVPVDDNTAVSSSMIMTGNAVATGATGTLPFLSTQATADCVPAAEDSTGASDATGASNPIPAKAINNLPTPIYSAGSGFASPRLSPDVAVLSPDGAAKDSASPLATELSPTAPIPPDGSLSPSSPSGNAAQAGEKEPTQSATISPERLPAIEMVAVAGPSSLAPTPDVTAPAASISPAGSVLQPPTAAAVAQSPSPASGFPAVSIPTDGAGQAWHDDAEQAVSGAKAGSSPPAARVAESAAIAAKSRASIASIRSSRPRKLPRVGPAQPPTRPPLPPARFVQLPRRENPRATCPTLPQQP